MAAVASRVRVALCQLLVGVDKAANLAAARSAIADAARHGVDIVALPECFNGAHMAGGGGGGGGMRPATQPSTAMLSAAAAEHRVFLVGGELRAGDASTESTIGPCLHLSRAPGLASSIPCSPRR
jgi:predicted amidohydrolase